LPTYDEVRRVAHGPPRNDSWTAIETRDEEVVDVVRIVFMGTPQFAVPSLERLAERQEVVTVVTQPDRRRGRGHRLQPPPVKQAAERLGLPVWQPPTLRTPEAVARLRRLAPDAVVVAAYAQILRPNVLDIPARGCINVHASLLPQYRGAEPIVAAILAGEAETGVTIMLIDEGLDTGPTLAQRAIPIAADDTRARLTDKLSRLGATLLLEVLPGWLDGEIPPQPQADASASYAPRLRKEDGEIDWNQPAAFIERMVRAYAPWPGTYTQWQGRRLKLLRSRRLPLTRATPGEVIETSEGVAVVAGEGALLLEEVQLAGKKAMSVVDFVRGQRGLVGSHLPS
jgi:methionyl-tRNA formyltransferase